MKLERENFSFSDMNNKYDLDIDKKGNLTIYQIYCINIYHRVVSKTSLTTQFQDMRQPTEQIALYRRKLKIKSFQNSGKESLKA